MSIEPIALKALTPLEVKQHIFRKVSPILFRENGNLVKYEITWKTRDSGVSTYLGIKNLANIPLNHQNLDAMRLRVEEGIRLFDESANEMMFRDKKQKIDFLNTTHFSILSERSLPGIGKRQKLVLRCINILMDTLTYYQMTTLPAKRSQDHLDRLILNNLSDSSDFVYCESNQASDIVDEALTGSTSYVR
jgi:hypothetical protein